MRTLLLGLLALLVSNAAAQKGTTGYAGVQVIPFLRGDAAFGAQLGFLSRVKGIGRAGVVIAPAYMSDGNYWILPLFGDLRLPLSGVLDLTLQPGVMACLDTTTVMTGNTTIKTSESGGFAWAVGLTRFGKPLKAKGARPWLQVKYHFFAYTKEVSTITTGRLADGTRWYRNDHTVEDSGRSAFTFALGVQF